MGVHQDKEVYLQIKKLLGIPDDEPIVIFRAQDKFSVFVLQAYKTIAHGKTIIGQEVKEWVEQLDSIIKDFAVWQRDNRDKVKVPD